jgi:hypothetical protein
MRRERRPSASRRRQDACWICLAGHDAGPLSKPCRCPRLVHRECLARWQLRRLKDVQGDNDGSRCRFCAQQLPAWTSAAPLEGGPAAAAVAIVSIHIAGEVHQVGAGGAWMSR